MLIRQHIHAILHAQDINQKDTSSTVVVFRYYKFTFIEIVSIF